MPATTATLDLSIWRNDDVYEFPIRVIGPNLTGVSVRAQVRMERDTPGAPLIALETVSNGNAEGIRLVTATLTDGRWVNDLRVRINKSTRQALPYSGELGDATSLRWALAIAGRTRIDGNVLVLAHALDSDSAPSARPPSYGASYRLGSAMPAAGATLTIAADSVAELVIDGADLLGGLVADTAAIRDTAAVLAGQASGSQAAAKGSEVASGLYASSALASMGGLMFKSTDAGLADARKPAFFTVPGDNAATAAILYERTGESTFDFTTGTMPAGATLTRAAGPASRVDSAGVMQFSTAADVARFDYDPVSKAARGLLVEPARTNFFLGSSDLSSAPWTQAGVTYGNGTTAPDGSVSRRATVTNNYGPYQKITQNIAANDPFVMTVYRRSAAAQAIGLGFNGAGNATNNVAIIAPANGTSWNRDAYPRNMTADSTGIFAMPAPAGPFSGGFDRVVPTPITVDIWGAQLERGGAPTSYIPTTTAMATRPADVLTLDWGNKGGPQTGNVTIRYTFDDGTTQDIVQALTAGKMTVDPTALNRYAIKSARLLLSTAVFAVERARLPSAAVVVKTDMTNVDPAAAPSYRQQFLNGGVVRAPYQGGWTDFHQVNGYMAAIAHYPGRHRLENEWRANNTVAVRNHSNDDAYSAVCFERYDGREQGAIGYGNPGTGINSPFAGAYFRESSDFILGNGDADFANAVGVPIRDVVTCNMYRRFDRTIGHAQYGRTQHGTDGSWTFHDVHPDWQTRSGNQLGNGADKRVTFRLHAGAGFYGLTAYDLDDYTPILRVRSKNGYDRGGIVVGTTYEGTNGPPPAQVAGDFVGTVLTGRNVDSGRATEMFFGSLLPGLCHYDSAGFVMRAVRPGVGKFDLFFADATGAKPLRAAIVDRDHAAIEPLWMAMDGSGKVGIGGNVGFNGTAPIAKVALPAASGTDTPLTIAIRNALIAYGLATAA